MSRLKASGPVTQHYDGPYETDGPWLYIWPIEGKGEGRLPMLVVPSHAVIDVTPCDGSCDG